MRTVNETDLHAVVLKSINEVYAKQDNFLPQLKANIAKVLGISNLTAVAEIDEKINEKQQEIIRLTKARQNCDALGNEVFGSGKKSIDSRSMMRTEKELE